MSWEFSNKAAIISSVIGAVVVVASGIAYFEHVEYRMGLYDSRLTALESRMNSLEAQQKLIKAAPEVIVQSDHPTVNPPQPIPNPLIATCIELIRQETEAGRRTDIHAEIELSSRISTLDCVSALKAQATAK